MLRKGAGQARTRLVNKVRQILRRHNLQWEMPTKKFPTLLAIAWLKQLVLPEIDRLEMNHLLADLKQVQQQIEDLEKEIALRCANSDDAVLLATIPGVAAFTAVSLACRIGAGQKRHLRRKETKQRRREGDYNSRFGHVVRSDPLRRIEIPPV